MINAKYHRALGHHSNIPDCCIEAFINRETFPGVGYGRCENCWKRGTVVEIHRCNRDCVPFLKSIGVPCEKLDYQWIENESGWRRVNLTELVSDGE